MSERPNGKIERVRHPIIDSIRMVQDIAGHISQRLAPHETQWDMLAHMEGEFQELTEAMTTGDRKKVGQELPDIVIFCMRLADAYGVDMAESLTRKIERNAHKYNTFEVQKLVDSGMTHEQARLHLKNSWDRGRDQEFDIT